MRHLGFLSQGLLALVSTRRVLWLTFGVQEGNAPSIESIGGNACHLSCRCMTQQAPST